MVSPPTIRKNSSQRPAAVRPSRAPKTTSMAMRGMTDSTASTRPRFSSPVTSVTQALKAASLAELPKKVITQSKMMTMTAAARTARAAGRNRSSPCTDTRAKAMTLRPHSR